MLGTAGAVMNDPRTYALWTGASAVGGGLVAWGLSATAASAEMTTLGVGTGLDAFSSQALNQLISAAERQLLRDFFKTKVLPKALSPRALRIYAEIAKRAIAAGKDGLGVQAARLALIEEALRKLAE